MRSLHALIKLTSSNIGADKLHLYSPGADTNVGAVYLRRFPYYISPFFVDTALPRRDLLRIDCLLEARIEIAVLLFFAKIGEYLL